MSSSVRDSLEGLVENIERVRSTDTMTAQSVLANSAGSDVSLNGVTKLPAHAQLRKRKQLVDLWIRNTKRQPLRGVPISHETFAERCLRTRLSLKNLHKMSARYREEMEKVIVSLDYFNSPIFGTDMNTTSMMENNKNFQSITEGLRLLGESIVKTKRTEMQLVAQTLSAGVSRDYKTDHYSKEIQPRIDSTLKKVVVVVKQLLVSRRWLQLSSSFDGEHKKFCDSFCTLISSCTGKSEKRCTFTSRMIMDNEWMEHSPGFEQSTRELKEKIKAAEREEKEREELEQYTMDLKRFVQCTCEELKDFLNFVIEDNPPTLLLAKLGKTIAKHEVHSTTYATVSGTDSFRIHSLLLDYLRILKKECKSIVSHCTTIDCQTEGTFTHWISTLVVLDFGDIFITSCRSSDYMQKLSDKERILNQQLECAFNCLEKDFKNGVDSSDAFMIYLDAHLKSREQLDDSIISAMQIANHHEYSSPLLVTNILEESTKFITTDMCIEWKTGEDLWTRWHLTEKELQLIGSYSARSKTSKFIVPLYIYFSIHFSQSLHRWKQSFICKLPQLGVLGSITFEGIRQLFNDEQELTALFVEEIEPFTPQRITEVVYAEYKAKTCEEGREDAGEEEAEDGQGYLDDDKTNDTEVRGGSKVTMYE